MQYSDFISFLKENGISVFTVKEASKILEKSALYTAKFLNSRDGIMRIEKGKYAVMGVSDDIIASHIVYPSYISLISALRYYNLTTQLPMEKYVITTARHKPLLFHKYMINFIKVNKKLMFGFKEVNDALVATPEKAFIDALYLKKAIWYNEEFDAGVERGVIKMDVLKNYAIQLGNRELAKRLAVFLETRYSIDCSDLNRLYASPKSLQPKMYGKNREKIHA